MAFEQTTETSSAPPVGRQRDQRYIYTGDSRAAVMASQTARVNRKGVQRRVSPFNLMLVIVGSGIAVVLYISNLLAVNQLARDIAELRMNYDRIASTNAVLRAEVSRKSASDRIETAARGLKLQYPTGKVMTFSVDEDLLNTLKNEEQPQ
jgi:cell division protein FtsB